MVGFLAVIAWLVAGIGVVFLVGAAVGRFPRRLAFFLIGVVEVGTILGVAVDAVSLVGGRQVPDLPTHIGYLLTTPLITPAGLALTYKKLDRWGLVIIGVAVLITAIMVVRQVQTLGVPFGYVNAHG